MHTLSREQALGIWSELEQAYHKTNGFWSDTAEIYIYRLANGARFTHRVHIKVTPR